MCYNSDFSLENLKDEGSQGRWLYYLPCQVEQHMLFIDVIEVTVKETMESWKKWYGWPKSDQKWCVWKSFEQTEEKIFRTV